MTFYQSQINKISGGPTLKFLIWKQSGFTLAELILYVGLMSAMMLTVTLFLGTILEARVKNQTIAEVEQQGFQIAQIISQTIRNADGITTPGQGDSSTSLTLVMTGPTNPTIFSLLSEFVRVSEGGGAYTPLTNSRVVVSGLNFRNLSRAGTPGVISFQFTVSYKNNSNRNEYTYSRDFYGSATLRQS